MTTVQLKSEIKKAIDEVPENVLPEILDYLKLIQNQSPDDVKFDKNLIRIILEDRGLLKRLAE